MVFGKRVADHRDIREQIDIDDDENQEETFVEETQEVQNTEVKDDKPLLQEVTILAAGNSKNAGGAKQWVCKHCKQKFTSSYTRIHTHFFGAMAGKKAEIKRCSVVMNHRAKYERLLNKVKEAKKVGVARGLKNSILTKKHPYSSSRKPLEDAFAVVERNTVDLKIMRGLCANGIPFNVLRNPNFLEMVTAINNAPKGYKPPSSEKARMTLLDECHRDVEKDLDPIKATWYTQGVSIVSDGWTNVKHKPLINVLAVNSRGATFMYAGDFSGVEKTGVAIANYLLGAIDTVGLSNVLQVVTDNAANCKAAGKEMEKAVAMFRDNSKLELLKVAKTRFASHYILLKRLVDCREALATTIALNSWRDWVKQGDKNARTTGANVVDTIRVTSFGRMWKAF